MANVPSFFLLTRRTEGGGALGASGGPRRRPRVRRRPGSGRKEGGRLVGSIPPPPRFQGRRPVGRGAMAAGGSRRRRPWWRRCEARRRPGAGGKGEGDLGVSIAPLTSGRGGARRRLRGGRRGSAAMAGGGGVGSSGRRPEVAVGVVVVGKWRRGLFIGVEGGGEEGTRRWPAGGLGGVPLMAFGRYRGVVEQRRGRRGGHRTTGRLGQA